MHYYQEVKSESAQGAFRNSCWPKKINKVDSLCLKSAFIGATVAYACFGETIRKTFLHVFGAMILLLENFG